MNLSMLNNRTTTAARKRNGQACLALNAGGAYRLERQEWRGFKTLRSAKPAALLSIRSTPVVASFCFDLGGSPSIGTPAIGTFRMHAAPLTLDPSANQQEGDA